MPACAPTDVPIRWCGYRLRDRCERSRYPPLRFTAHGQSNDRLPEDSGPDDLDRLSLLFTTEPGSNVGYSRPQFNLTAIVRPHRETGSTGERSAVIRFKSSDQRSTPFVSATPYGRRRGRVSPPRSGRDRLRTASVAEVTVWLLCRSRTDPATVR